MEIHLNTRKSGTQTPLSDSEKKYLSDLLGGKYKIGSPLGRSGASTSAFLITDATGKEFVLRIPNKPDDIEHWLETEKRQFANQEKYLAGYQGNISIPKTLEYRDFFTIQEKGAGEPFADYIYDGLSREKQLKLAQDFAAFLNHSHQKNANRATTRPVSLDGGQDFTLNEHVKSAYKSVMTPDEYKWFCGLLDEFNNRDTSDEFLTFAFNDFRYSNILYDTKSGQLSVIDFGACRDGSIYMDFVPASAGSYGISYKFLQDVINSYNMFAYNFESGAVKEQLGRCRTGGDYWLSFVGPAEGFKAVADAGKIAGSKIGAKIQVGNSHEVATVPFVPVPGLLYRKYKAMKEAGVSSVLQCWYFGNYPGIMNKAAGELSFSDFADDEDTFLRKLAAPYWGRDAELVASVWKRLSDAYAEYPLSNNMQYYGPFHAGPAWPLHAEVRLLPLGRTWKTLDPPSGDTIGEALENHTIEEATLLAMRMSNGAQMRDASGRDILDVLAERWKGHPERIKDIGVMRALQCQFESGCNILRFYACRAKAIYESRVRKNTAAAITAVETMDRIASEEEAVTSRLLPLAVADSRLGFHSEAEAHQYHPAKLEWRLRSLTRTHSEIARILSVLKDGGEYPESALERNAPYCRAGGEWTDLPGGSRFRVKDEPNGDMSVDIHLKGKDPILMNTLDAAGVTWYRTLSIQPDGTVRASGIGSRNRVSPSHEVVARSVESAAEGVIVKFTISSLSWGGSDERRPGWIQFEGKDNSVWPNVDKPHIAPRRLNIGRMYGDSFARILR